MIEFLSTLISPFHAKMLAVLLSATQWTVYLSLTAFMGSQACSCLHLDFPVRSSADAFILDRSGDPDFLSG